MRRLLILFILIITLIVPAAAECQMYFGANYSHTITNKEGYDSSDAMGVNYSVLWNWGKFKGLYLSAFILYEPYNYNKPETWDSFKITSYKSSCVNVYLRAGYPFDFTLSENTTFTFIPCFAIDVLSTSATANDIDIGGQGEQMGAAFVASVQHKIGGLCLRYGVDIDVPVFRGMTYDYYKIYTDYDTIEDAHFITASPFIGVGFQL